MRCHRSVIGLPMPRSFLYKTQGTHISVASINHLCAYYFSDGFGPSAVIMVRLGLRSVLLLAIALMSMSDSVIAQAQKPCRLFSKSIFAELVLIWNY